MERDKQEIMSVSPFPPALQSSPVLPPPPPPPPGPAWAPSLPSKKKLYQAIAEGRTAVEGDFQEACLLLTQRETSFRKDLQWVLFNRYVPSLIQDGPKCGLVALWMASHLPKPAITVSIEDIMQKAVCKGYTAQGEMFSASDMALLAEEVCGIRVQRLSGGMTGDNAALILKHLTDGQPILIPYDEDFNHEPCQRSGHKAHWAVASGVLLGLAQGTVSSDQLPTDTSLPWVHLSTVSAPATWLLNPAEVYILAKQGKSLRYQLWKLETVAQSNAQLQEMDPQRACDGSHYVLPPGGVEEGLAGQRNAVIRTPLFPKFYHLSRDGAQATWLLNPVRVYISAKQEKSRLYKRSYQLLNPVEVYILTKQEKESALSAIGITSPTHWLVNHVEVYISTKQEKSLRYQLSDLLHQLPGASNLFEVYICAISYGNTKDIMETSLS